MGRKGPDSRVQPLDLTPSAGAEIGGGDELEALGGGQPGQTELAPDAGANNRRGITLVHACPQFARFASPFAPDSAGLMRSSIAPARPGRLHPICPDGMLVGGR